ncbi:MAG: FAD-dependent oxidoreductase [Hymenobacter sp.]
MQGRYAPGGLQLQISMEGLTKIEDLGKPRVVIVGGGFGGWPWPSHWPMRRCRWCLLISRTTTASGRCSTRWPRRALNPDSIVSPYRKIMGAQENFYFRLAEVLSVDATAQVVETSIGLLRYDYLVLAMGTRSNYFGDAEMERNSISLKTVPEAIELRNTLLSNFEQALQIGDVAQLNRLLDFVIVGGGPTGVEMAGALSELRDKVFPRDYRELDLKQMDIHLVQSGPVLLKGMSAEASAAALKYLTELGVKVWLNDRVKSYDGYTADLKSGQQLITRTLIWAAGVTRRHHCRPRPGRPATLQPLPGQRIQPSGRLHQRVRHRRHCPNGHRRLPRGPPAGGAAGHSAGRVAGRKHSAGHEGQAMEAFHYRDKGTMATIGRHRAVGDIKLFGKELHVTGWLGWIAWSLVHVLALVSFRNRLAVFFTWAWNYVSQDKGMRYIIGQTKSRIQEKEVDVKAIV